MCRFLFLVAAAVPGSLENNVLAVCLMKCSGKGFFPTLRGLLVFKYQRKLFAAKL